MVGRNLTPCSLQALLDNFDLVFLAGIGWYFSGIYHVGNFGIVNLAGIPFSLKRGALAPFLMHPSPLFEEYRSSHQIVQKGVPAKSSAR
jgi:hypothetical protein